MVFEKWKLGIEKLTRKEIDYQMKVRYLQKKLWNGQIEDIQNFERKRKNGK